jgi:hypothetical protein
VDSDFTFSKSWVHLHSIVSLVTQHPTENFLCFYSAVAVLNFHFSSSPQTNGATGVDGVEAGTMYTHAFDDRLRFSDELAKMTRGPFLKATISNFLILQLLFIGLYSYLMGSLFQQETHIQNIEILFVDYDRGGVIGSAIRDAYASLRGGDFPTFVERSTDEFFGQEDLQGAVCRADYWGALYITLGASQRLLDAMGGGGAADGYNRSDAVAFIWNEARYPAVADSNVAVAIQTLSSTARRFWTIKHANSTVQTFSVSPSSYAAAGLSVFANPWDPVSINIKSTTQGARVIYNTMAIILVIIQEFFYLGVINGLYVTFHIWERYQPTLIILFRNTISLVCTFIGSLCTIGMIWAFRSGWGVDGRQFMLSWMTIWLFGHVNFNFLDAITLWIPQPYVPMALISWIVISVTSVILPFELSPGFYRWGYAIPTHEAYQVLIHIWSGGCNPQLYRALPVLFAWEVASIGLDALGVYRRCHVVALAAKSQETIVAAEMPMGDERRTSMGDGDGDMGVPERLPTDGNGGGELEPQATKEGFSRRGSSAAKTLDVSARNRWRYGSPHGMFFHLPFSAQSKQLHDRL